MTQVTNTTTHVIRLPDSRRTMLAPGVATDVETWNEIKDHKHVKIMVERGTLAVGRAAGRAANPDAAAALAGSGGPGKDGPRKGPEDAGTTPVLGESEEEEAEHAGQRGTATGAHDDGGSGKRGGKSRK